MFIQNAPPVLKSLPSRTAVRIDHRSANWRTSRASKIGTRWSAVGWSKALPSFKLRSRSDEIAHRSAPAGVAKLKALLEMVTQQIATGLLGRHGGCDFASHARITGGRDPRMAGLDNTTRC